MDVTGIARLPRFLSLPVNRCVEMRQSRRDPDPSRALLGHNQENGEARGIICAENLVSDADAFVCSTKPIHGEEVLI